MDSKWTSGSYSSHRHSLRPGGKTSGALASRYGLNTLSSANKNNGSSASSAASAAANSATGMGASFVSMVRKLVTKTSTNSIDSSFKQYQKELQAQSTSKATTSLSSSNQSKLIPFASSSTSSSSAAGTSALSQVHHYDTGYSSNANSPATTPTVSSISASPIPSTQYSSTSVSSSTTGYATAGDLSRPSSAASSTSTQRGPFLSRIRAKVVSTFQPTGEGVDSIGNTQSSGYTTPTQTLNNVNKLDSLFNLTSGDPLSCQRQQRSSSVTSTSHGANHIPVGTVTVTNTATTSSAINTYTSSNTISPGQETANSPQRAPMLSMLSQSHSSSLTNEQLTAHLTEEEKKILEKVFQKEEEFQQIALKNFVKSTTMNDSETGGVGSCGGTGVNSLPNQTIATQLLTGSPVSGVSHLSANLLDPVAAAVHRRRSSAIMSADATGFCRICRKVIMKDESAHRCSNCAELVCDDCSSYSARDESKYWMCSFCRRRGSHLILTQTGSLLGTGTQTTTEASLNTATSTSMSMVAAQSASATAMMAPKSPILSNRRPSTSSSYGPNAPPMSSGNMSTTSQFVSTLQPTTVTTTTKRKASFSECQMRAQHEAVSSQRQSSLDLPRPIMQQLQQQRKSAQFTQSPLLQQPNPAQFATVPFSTSSSSSSASSSTPWSTTNSKQHSTIPCVELSSLDHNDQMNNQISVPTDLNGIVIAGQSTYSSMLMQPTPSSSLAPSPSLPTTSTATPSTAISISPQNGHVRTRIYSLSDDEELLTDEEEDDDDDDELENNDGHRAVRSETDRDERSFSGEQIDYEPSVTFETCGKAFNGKSYQRKDENIIGRTSHGTLSSAPIETLKRRKSSKRKKKKKKPTHHGTTYNSDDELITGVCSKQENDMNVTNSSINSNQSNTITSRRESADKSTLNIPNIIPTMTQTGEMTSFADVVNTVAARGLLTQRASFSGMATTSNDAHIQRMGPFYNTTKFPPIPMSMTGHKPSPLIASKWWRLSKKIGTISRGGSTMMMGPYDNAIFDYGNGMRPRKSSESSDLSDVRYSPPQDSLTPSSDYSRSPRESADSEMLGLPYSGLNMQRRSIPSVLIDVGGDNGCGLQTGAYLSLKDCYNRRGSTGRTLPQVEPSRSMLDLPHSRKSSAHSLDIPMEQPRRASAPEGENIRIVIDEVQDVSGSHQDIHTGMTSNGPEPERIHARTGLSGTRSSTGAIVPLQPTLVTQVQVAPQGQTSFQQRMRYQLSRAASIVTHYERIILHKDENDHSNRTRGFGLSVVGGRVNEQDGMLYAYVSWLKPGGSADQQGLKTGDKILEWCGKSLVNCSYEQVCHIMDTGGDTVELIVESMVKCDPTHDKKRRQSLAAQRTQPKISIEPAHTSKSSVTQPLRPSSAAATLLTTIPTQSTPTPPPPPPPSVSSLSSDHGSTLSASSTPRRRLPAIPTSAKSTTTTTTPVTYLCDAQIYLQVTLDANINQLSVVIISAKGLDKHSLYQSNLNGSTLPNEAYAQLRLLPEMGFKVCQTELSNKFEWNETLIYHQFPLEKVDEITLDVSVWVTNQSFTTNSYSHQLPVPSNQIRIRSPRHSMVGLPPQIAITDAVPDVSNTFQLASTRIPLRSALFHLSEWWPLIPTEVNYVQGPSVVIPTIQPSAELTAIPSPAPNILSNVPPVFFHKAPSMEYIDINNSKLLGDSIMMSRSTPGSRRNSDRSVNEMEIITEASPMEPRANESVFGPSIYTNTLTTKRPSTSMGNYRPPTRGSTATLSSSTGRHSLDDSSYSNSMGGPRSAGDGGGSLSLGRTTSLRMIQNRHSVGNLYHHQPMNDANSMMMEQARIRGDHLVAPSNELYERRKSSSTIGNQTKISNTRDGFKHCGPSPYSAGYSCFTGVGGSYQHLLSQQQLTGNYSQPISDQDTSPFSSDDDIDNLLLDESNFGSDQNTPVRPQSTTFSTERPHSSICVPDGSEQPELDSALHLKLSDNKLNQLTVVDSNKLSTASIDDQSRFSGTTSPATPMNEEEPDECTGSNSSTNLLVPNWATPGGRRKSFLQRLMPTGVTSASSILSGRQSDQNVGTSDSTPKPVIVGEIKLGFVMTKGFLEIDVTAARNLPDSVTGPYPPDTYVKTYVYDRGRQLYKRKTRVVAANHNPVYKQVLKYDASIVYGRSLLVSVWEKQHKTFEPNIAIGATEINVNQLELHKLHVKWYRLRAFQNPSHSSTTDGDNLPIETSTSTSTMEDM